MIRVIDSMNVEEFTPDEYLPENEDEAEVLAVLTERIPVYDRLEKNYRFFTEEDLKSRMKELYEEDRFVEAENLIDAFERFDSYNIEKEFNEIKSRSYRFSEKNFIGLVKEAYQNDISIADVLRKNISSIIQEGIQTLKKNSCISEERIEIIEDITRDWSEKMGRSPVKNGYRLSSYGYELNSHFNIFKPDKEKYERFARYISKKKLENLFENSDINIGYKELVNIFLKCYELLDEEEDFQMFGDEPRISYNRNDNELILNIEEVLMYLIEPWSNPDEFISDLVNSSYSDEDIQKIFEEFLGYSNISDKVISIRNELRDDQEEDHDDIFKFVSDSWSQDVENDIDRLTDFIVSKYPTHFEIRKVLKSDDEGFTLGGVPLERGRIKDMIMEEILEDETEKLEDIEKAKEKAKESLEEGDIETARKINQQITVYDSCEYVAEKLEKKILDSLTPQVVSVTMPKGVYGLIKFLDVNKEDMLR